MTELLKKAFERASKLPDDQQDALAAVMLDELESEHRWAEALANSQDKLGQLADAALDESKQGKTRPFSEL